MVVPTDIQFSFVAAAIFTDLGRSYILVEHQKSPECSRVAYGKFRLRALIFPILFLIPAAIISLLAWPGWESQYWSLRMEQTLGNALNASAIGIFLVLMPLAAFLGNWLGFRWVIRGHIRLLRLVYLAVLAITGLIVYIQWPAPIRLGTVSQFQSDPGSLPFIWQDNTFFITFVVLLVYCALPLIVLFFRIRRESALASSS